MKNINRLFLIVLSFVFITSCDKDFDEMNESKTAATAIDPAFILNRAVLNSSFQTAQLVYEIGIVQQIVTPNSGVLTGANYNQDNRASTQGNWQNYYRNVIRNTKDVIAQASGDPARINLVSMARILQANAFMVLTDTYGNIPYSEGGDGYNTQIFFPAYDTQESIYPKIIQELQEASAALTASGRVERADVLFGGDVEKWRKFGYSLMLRAGMRLSEVSPATAQSTVAAAFNGGVILTNDNNAFIRHDANYANPMGNTLNSTEAANFYLAKPFVDALQSTNDPRLSAIAIRYVGATSGPTQVVEVGSKAAADQIGMPLGHDNGTVTGAAEDDGLASFYDYSQVDRRRMAKLASPAFLVTAAQTNLLLAEARFRGWITSGTAAQYFAAGISAHMDQLATFDAASAVAATDRDTYLAANPLGAGTELEQINTQYWIASFLNGPEAFANFRRSSFPALSPNPFPGREVTFINRLTYPNSEISVNTEQVNAAIAAQGADDLETRVWWDK
ncbi:MULTISPECIES: SusD/RagB family nutrient-binding outer membrane lipoprotein [unclassified Imperialibacter]|uniref:SusD/RagB family nutrient-binding outer membrane lipoprotein n=1 Tax=unclassified Imperialibacter TaxID=2629706 RepID=UPI001252AB09|nr:MULTISPECIES: SusD/RagB family nutrient-binding outer membrane lipoprotein [unclassified Imperialibacter]CAD5277400.1 SusD/RagB family nutrient-binding outer membrane lipoprotein [Imperialibacter sp. 75]CAD5295338.1 SusD/RagB family nutrient-binding outer membrane lipoprotein [Imperialibacter sp. 89]VVT12121.1 conserved hypothetical protein [Imperialibacter sp. EC-SDR9]